MSVPGFSLDHFDAPKDKQDTPQQGNLLFPNFNFGTEASATATTIANFFLATKPSLTDVFTAGPLAAKKQLVDSKLEFSFVQSDGKPKLAPEPEPEPEPEPTPKMDTSVLTDYVAKYSHSFASNLVQSVIHRAEQTDTTGHSSWHSLVASDGRFVYAVANTVTGATLLKVDVANHNSLQKQALGITDYINALETPTFDDYLLLYSQKATTLYILDRSTKKQVTKFQDVFAYYSYAARTCRTTYILMLTANYISADISIHITDLRTLSTHVCPVPIFTFADMEEKAKQLQGQLICEFRGDNVKRGYLLPFGASLDSIQTSSSASTVALGKTQQARTSFCFEEAVFYVGLEIFLPIRATILVHSMVGPILLENVLLQLSQGVKIKASKMIQKISNAAYSTDYYLVQEIDPININNGKSRVITDITPVAVCSLDETVHTHYFLHILFQEDCSVSSLYELIGAETFLYEAKQPITMTLASPMFTHTDATVQLYRACHLETRATANRVSAQILQLGMRVSEGSTCQLITSVFDVASASLEETATAVQGSHPILLGYDPRHDFIMCAPSQFTSVILLHKVIEVFPAAEAKSVNRLNTSGFLLVQPSIESLSATVSTVPSSLESYTSLKDQLNMLLNYINNSKAENIDPSTFAEKLESLNESLFFILSHTSAKSPIQLKSLVDDVKSLLLRVLQNNDLIIRAVQKIGVALCVPSGNPPADVEDVESFLTQGNIRI